ncbi:MAG: DNA-processing protein DprA [Euzebya sp.]
MTSNLLGDVQRLQAGGVTPEDLDRVRRRLGLDASVAQVITEMSRNRRLWPADDARDRRRRDMQIRDMQILVCGITMPARLTQTWSLGGPLWLWLHGGPVPSGPAVAVVGTRRPTADGLRLAHDMAHDLAGAGVVVVSGMARGIDQAAHQGALRGGGKTVAVLGTGHDIDYPAGSGELRQAVADSGGVLSEYSPDRGIRHRAQFIHRNRILVGLVDAVVVIEAGIRSGALNSATWAADMGRDVMVVPSSPSNPAAAGALALLGEGAIPVRGAADVLGLLNGLSPAGSYTPEAGAPPVGRTASQAANLDLHQRRVLDLTSPVPASPSALSSAAGLSTREVLIAVATLEDLGLVSRQADGVVRK